MNVMKRTNAHFCIREKFKIPAYWYAQRLAKVIAWCRWFDATHATTGLTNYHTTYCNSFPTSWSYFEHWVKTWKFIRTAVHGSQPLTLSMALDTNGSEALHRTTLVLLLHH